MSFLLLQRLITINIELALSMNIDANLWLLTNSVTQIYIEFVQDFVHQEMNIVELLISYRMIPSSLSKVDANLLFVNSQRLESIFIESANN